MSIIIHLFLLILTVYMILGVLLYVAIFTHFWKTYDEKNDNEDDDRKECKRIYD